MNKPKLLTASTVLAFIFIFAMTGLDVILSYMGWKPTFGDDLLAGVIGFLPSIGSVSLSMLIGITPSWKTKILASVIWLFCITISLTGNFLNMTARAFESLDTENIAKVEVVNIKDASQTQIEAYKNANSDRIKSFKAATKEKLSLVDLEITDLLKQYEKARDLRDFQINDGVNRDGSVGPKARAFQAAMDTTAVEIEEKRKLKRDLQSRSTVELLALQDELAKNILEFHERTSSSLSEANVELVTTQNDMRGHMPVIRYFIPNKDHQRNAVLWGLGIFAAVISLAGPIVSYAMAVHLNHKRLFKKKIEKECELVEDDTVIESEVSESVVETDDIYINVAINKEVEEVEEAEVEEAEVAKQQEEQEDIKQAAIKKRIRRLKNAGYR